VCITVASIGHNNANAHLKVGYEINISRKKLAIKLHNYNNTLAALTHIC
jgi:hypothetical protein